MIEVEAKVHIHNVDEFRRKVRDLGRKISKEKKVDDYYTLSSLEKYPQKSLRIRKINGEYQINFKQKLSYVKGVHAKKEVEFKVSDIKGFLSLIEDFGFRKWLRKYKVSEVYEIKKNFHIEINFVKKLGWFIEVEYLCNPHQINNARREVLNVMRVLDIKDKDVIKEGYTKIFWDKYESYSKKTLLMC